MPEPLQYIKGYYIHFRNKGSMEKYNYISKIAPSERKHIEMYKKLCESEDEARLLGIVMGFTGVYYQAATVQQCKFLLKKWKDWFIRTAKYECPLEDLIKSTDYDMIDIMTETTTSTGCTAFKLYKQNVMNFIEFCLLLDCFPEFELRWKSLSWRLEKQHLDKAKEALKSLSSYRGFVDKTIEYFKHYYGEKKYGS